MQGEEEQRHYERLAEAMVKHLEARHQGFYIDPKEHYDAHMESDRIRRAFTEADMQAVKDLAVLFRQGRTLFIRVVLGLALLGTMALATYGAFVKFVKH